MTCVGFVVEVFIICHCHLQDNIHFIFIINTSYRITNFCYCLILLLVPLSVTEMVTNSLL